MSAGQGSAASAAAALRRREAELAASREEAVALHRELEETNRGLIALHAELEDARQAEARLAAIVQSSDDAMFSLTPDGVIQTWNPGAERLLGYRADEIVGRRADVLLPAGAGGDFAAALERLRSGRRAHGYDARRVRKDGRLVDVAVTLSAMRDAGGELTGLSAVLRDISARLRAEAELAAARAQQEVLADRDRMARDLHDRVIQRLFAAGLALQGTATVARPPETAARISAVVDDIDASIQEIREAIFTLRHGRREASGLRDRLAALAAEAEASLGFPPAVSFEGRLAAVPADLAGHVLAVAREALSNAARHAGASAVEVNLSAGADLVLRVRDNGRGLGRPQRSSGLRNMRERAETLGGVFDAAGEPGAGTRIEWRVPLGP